MASAAATDWILSIGTAVTPIVVGITAIYFARRQNRHSALTAARLDHYRQVAPLLNRLMCYFTFIGTWKRFTPPEVIAMKRELDELVAVGAPMFSQSHETTYRNFVGACFSTFGEWGQDARLNTSAYRRRDFLDGNRKWDPSWDSLFSIQDHEVIPGEHLNRIRALHDNCLRGMIKEISLTRGRKSYTTEEVVLNAHNAEFRDVDGASA